MSFAILMALALIAMNLARRTRRVLAQLVSLLWLAGFAAVIIAVIR